MSTVDMLGNSDVFSPHPNSGNVSQVQSVIESADGVYLDELPAGAVIEVETGHHTYRLENRGDGRALISGHPEYCPEPVLVDLHGSTLGGAMLKLRFIGRGMRMEFRHPVRGVITTSRVRDIHEMMPAC
jgi:hypothetical protein